VASLPAAEFEATIWMSTKAIFESCGNGTGGVARVGAGWPAAGGVAGGVCGLAGGCCAGGVVGLGGVCAMADPASASTRAPAGSGVLSSLILIKPLVLIRRLYRPENGI